MNFRIPVQFDYGTSKYNLTHIYFSQATISFKINNFLICLCSFDLSYPIFEKDNFIINLYICLKN